MSKNEGGKYISSCLTCKLLESMNFLQIELKNMNKRVITCLIFFGKTLRIATGRRSCMRTWQSWHFKPIRFKSCIDTRLLIFEEYPCGTLTPCIRLQKLNFSNFNKVWHAGGKYVCLPWGCGCNYKRIPISTRSLRTFIPSFIFLLIFSNVPNILLQTFFSTYITSIECLTSNFDQYGSSKNIDFFLLMFFTMFFFCIFPKVTLTWQTRLPLPCQLRVEVQFCPLVIH